MEKKPVIILLILFLALSLTVTPAFALMGSSSGYRLDSAALTNSGAKGSSLSYTLPVATVGDVSGKGTSSSYKLCVGLAEQRSGACDPVPPPPPRCTYNCGPGPGPIPPDEPTQEPIPPPEPPPTPPEEPTQEPIPAPPEEPTQEPIPQPEPPPMHRSPYEKPPVVPEEIGPLPEIMEAPFVEPSAPRALELLTGVWCAENACFDEPIFILRHAAAPEQAQEECIPGSSTETTCGLVYVVRPWIIWLTVALLLLVAILSGIYVRAKIRLYEALSKSQRLSPRRPVRRKRGTSLNRKKR